MMDCNATRIPYKDTKAFSGIIIDYLEQADALKHFYAHPPTLEGLQAAIEARKNFQTDRSVLVNVLKQQYQRATTSVNTATNIDLLEKATSFTITTAHQPNIFTGPLYFIYKIVHTIRLAENCKTLFPEYDFVPVYYMGNEDADLDELGHFYLQGEKQSWVTQQTGAVGRMKVDKDLLRIISLIKGQLLVLPHGEELVNMITECYHEGTSIQEATFQLVNALFAAYGLVVLLPDQGALKKQLHAVFQDDLLQQSASGIVEKTAAALGKAGYKVQANPREINLFYLLENSRERIAQTGEQWSVLNGGPVFTREQLINELTNFPERFSPNVILRGLYQETILPNIAFVGGGGETAYWLQLKELFAYYQVPFPVLVLRNSFLIIEKKWQSRIEHLGFSLQELFRSESDLVNQLVVRDSQQKLRLNGTLAATEKIYEDIKEQAGAIDPTLINHVDALKTNTLYRLQELEKKMLRAEKRKFADQQRQIQTLKSALFPRHGLQERVDNFMPYYAAWGKEFIQELYKHSLGLEQEFVVLSEV